MLKPKDVALAKRAAAIRGRVPANSFDLLRRIDEAVAWGVPDRESVGMTPTTLTSLLSEAASEIRRLQRS